MLHLAGSLSIVRAPETFFSLFAPFSWDLAVPVLSMSVVEKAFFLCVFLCRSIREKWKDQGLGGRESWVQLPWALGSLHVICNSWAVRVQWGNAHLGPHISQASNKSMLFSALQPHLFSSKCFKVQVLNCSFNVMLVFPLNVLFPLGDRWSFKMTLFFPSVI